MFIGRIATFYTFTDRAEIFHNSMLQIVRNLPEYSKVDSLCQDYIPSNKDIDVC